MKAYRDTKITIVRGNGYGGQGSYGDAGYGGRSALL